MVDIVGIGPAADRAAASLRSKQSSKSSSVIPYFRFRWLLRSETFFLPAAHGNGPCSLGTFRVFPLPFKEQHSIVEGEGSSFISRLADREIARLALRTAPVAAAFRSV